MDQHLQSEILTHSHRLKVSLLGIWSLLNAYKILQINCLMANSPTKDTKTQTSSHLQTSSLHWLVSPFPNPTTPTLQLGHISSQSLWPLAFSRSWSTSTGPCYALLPVISQGLQPHRDAHVAIRGSIFQWHPSKPRSSLQRSRRSPSLSLENYFPLPLQLIQLYEGQTNLVQCWELVFLCMDQGSYTLFATVIFN